MYYTISAVNNKGAHQTVWMCRLNCAFVVRMWHRTNFLMKWLVFFFVEWIDLRTPVINKPFIKKFATVNKSTKIKQNRITSMFSLWRCVSVCSQTAKIDHNYWTIRSILKKQMHTHWCLWYLVQGIVKCHLPLVEALPRSIKKRKEMKLAQTLTFW